MPGFVEAGISEHCFVQPLASRPWAAANQWTKQKLAKVRAYVLREPLLVEEALIPS